MPPCCEFCSLLWRCLVAVVGPKVQTENLILWGQESVRSDIAGHEERLDLFFHTGSRDSALLTFRPSFRRKPAPLSFCSAHLCSPLLLPFKPIDSAFSLSSSSSAFSTIQITSFILHLIPICPSVFPPHSPLCQR